MVVIAVLFLLIMLVLIKGTGVGEEKPAAQTVKDVASGGVNILLRLALFLSLPFLCMIFGTAFIGIPGG
jgi:hypothetical protein